MAKAVLNGTVIAESDETIIVEGNHYFPLKSVKQTYLRSSHFHTACYWKGVASYYDVEVNQQVSKNAAWYYPNPSIEASQIKDHVAFWRDVKVIA